ncbi:S41 family peptidase [Niabella pedocola]|uniref:S41 family peptidase n=1 Tax=Niabella pedocola TaxID=1752077 RepID=A0ABS8PRB6_9BACT|nr:S41 family peptidase [Niabella pedocola]MCD2423601.1 S41 family peptidase [Niabella pedocola]
MRFLLLFCSLLQLTVAGHTQPSARQIQNIEAFTKLFGYIRYFHPSDEAASINWDQFAVYGAHQVLKASSDEELVRTLSNLFMPIAPSIQLGPDPHFNVASITPEKPQDHQNIFWFHSGVGINDRRPYSSKRINRPTGASTGSSEGSALFTQVIDASGLKGKQIRMEGEMKADVTDGSGYFRIKIYKAGEAGLSYNIDSEPAQKNEWTVYKVSGTVEKNARQIILGGMLKGTGSVWFDDMKVFAYDDVLKQWKPVTINNGDFETWSNALPADWNIAPVKRYKYTMATVESNKVLSIASENMEMERNRPVVNIHTISYKHIPAPGTTLQKSIAKNIAVIFPIALYGTDSHTFPVADSAKLDALRKEITAFYQQHKMAGNLSVRLGTIAIAWNLFKHFFPYWEDTSQSADELLSEAIKRSFADTTPLEFRHTLLKLMEPLNDGHVRVGLWGDTTHAYSVPLQLAWVEGKVVVEQVLESSVSGIKRGAVITAINGKDVMDVYKDKMSSISGSPQWKSYAAVSTLLDGSRYTTVEISYRQDGALHRKKWERSFSNAQYYNSLNRLKKPSGRIENDLFYLDMSTVLQDSIDKWMPELAKARGIICDFRGHPESNNDFINHLLKEEEDTKWLFTPQTAYPDQENIEFKGSGWNRKPKKPQVAGKVVFIADSRAISLAESYLGFIKDFKLATIIGQPSAGANGDVNTADLPGGYTIIWTGMVAKNHDGSKHHIKGIVPDIPLERTLKGVVEGRDEFFEKALELISK